MKRRILVNIGLLLVIGLIAYICYATGKAYDVVMENMSYTIDGQEFPGMEAMQVTIDDQAEPIYLLDGDRMVGTAVGLKHVMHIDILDEDDKVTDSKTVPFSIEQLGKARTINIAKVYAQGKME